MSELQSLEIENSLQELFWAIATSQGEFSLILALCNAANLREQLVENLQASSELEIREIVLDKSIQAFYKTIKDSLGQKHPQALIVSGLESVTNLEQLIIAANQVREEFRKNFHFPLVLWVTSNVVQKLMRLAPDLYSWSTSVQFAINSDDLINFIQQTGDEVFAKVLAAGAGRYVNNAALNLQPGSSRRLELESAWNELQNRRLDLNPELEASLEFMLGRVAASTSMAESRQHYERSLALFQNNYSSPQSLSRQGIVLYSLGLWWCSYGVLHHSEQERANHFAKDYFQQCVQIFEQGNHPDLVAKFINALGAILQELQQWKDLEIVAQKALILHQTYPHQFKLARVYGFLAEVAISKSAGKEAKQAAEQAIFLVDSMKGDGSGVISEEMKADLDWERSYHQGFYLLSLGRSQFALNQPEAALQTLEKARLETKPQYDPKLYIRILTELRTGYFAKGEYLTAFHIKQTQRSIEQQYSLRAFIGAGRLQPQQIVINPGLPDIEQPGNVASEIAASGRQQDIKRLIERMYRHDHKLTIIHGQSGVGKSSILQAGLIPTLKQKNIGVRDVLPVLQQVYPDWIRELGKNLQNAILQLKYPPTMEQDLNSTTAILNQFKKHDDCNLLTVLIFDQFEEFFFVYKNPVHRRAFYNFLRECLDIPFVKVILSLREDYLYYLLECNNRLANFEVINNNILDKDILYFLDNFSPEDAKMIIKALSDKTQLVLETTLIDELVKDLARELREVRPIELQVVGAQLQTEKITQLEQYQQNGPKEKFVGRFLEEIINDCGADNEQIARVVLYLLTDENNTRPLKTRADLELELEFKKETLDLVLEILVASGLVFKIPAVLNDRYQLVHDYLVPFVRQQKAAGLIAELEKEREQRKLTETRLLNITQQQLKDARRATLTLVGLVVAISGTFLISTLFGLNFYLTSLSSKSAQNKEIQRLVSAIKSAKKLQKYSLGAVTETKLETLQELNQAFYQVREMNRLEGHTDQVTSVSFSADGNSIVTASKDKTAKVWDIHGKEIITLKGHIGAVTKAILGSNGKIIVTASEDHSVILWNRKGEKLKVLPLGDDIALSLSLSANNKILALGTKNNKVLLYNTDSGNIKILIHQDSVVNVAVNPDGSKIAGAGKDDIVKIWGIDDRKIKTIQNNYGILNMDFSSDGQYLIFTNQDRTVRIYNNDGILIKNILIPFYFNSRKFTMLTVKIETNIAAFVHSDSSKIGKYLIINKIPNDYGDLYGHSENVNYIAFRPDGKVVASASDKIVKLWNIDQIVKSWNIDDTDSQYNNKITKVISSYDSRMIATQNNVNKVTLWKKDKQGELETQSYKTIPGNNSVLSFSKDGKTLLTSSNNDIVKLWTLDKGEITLREHIGSVKTIKFSSDGKVIAVLNLDNKIRIWKNDGSFIQDLTDDDGIKQIDFSENSEIITTLSYKNVVKLWKKNGTHWKIQGTLIHSSLKDSNQYTKIYFSANEKIIATTGNNNLIKLWKNDGTLIKILIGHTDTVKDVIFSDDSEIIASISQDSNSKISTIKFWQIDGKNINEKIENYGIDNIYFSPESKIIVSTNSDNTIKMWNFKSTLLKTLKGHRDTINNLNFSPKIQILATTSDDNTVKLWRKGDYKEIGTLRGHKEKINSTSFSYDSKRIVTASDDKTVKIWTTEGKLIRTLTGHSDAIKSVCFNRDGNIISISTSSSRQDKRYNYTVIVWNSNGQKIKTIQGHTNNLDNFIVSENGETVAFVNKEDTLNVWNTDNANLLATLKGHNNWINSANFSPDGKMIASASDDKTVRLWSRDGKQIKILAGHKDKVNSVNFSPNSKIIASGSDDKTVKLWSNDGKLYKEYNKHEDKVNSVSFSPNGKTIASVSDDGNIKLWNTSGSDEKELTKINGGTSAFDSLSFSPDGSMLAFVSNKEITLYLPNSFWFKDSINLTSSYPLSNISFSPDNKNLAIPGLNKDEIVANLLDLDQLLDRACDRARDYLQNNRNVDPSDRHLCDK